MADIKTEQASNNTANKKLIVLHSTHTLISKTKPETLATSTNNSDRLLHTLLIWIQHHHALAVINETAQFAIEVAKQLNQANIHATPTQYPKLPSSKAKQEEVARQATLFIASATMMSTVNPQTKKVKTNTLNLTKLAEERQTKSNNIVIFDETTNGSEAAKYLGIPVIANKDQTIFGLATATGLIDFCKHLLSPTSNPFENYGDDAYYAALFLECLQQTNSAAYYTIVNTNDTTLIIKLEKLNEYKKTIDAQIKQISKCTTKELKHSKQSSLNALLNKKDYLGLTSALQRLNELRNSKDPSTDKLTKDAAYAQDFITKINTKKYCPRIFEILLNNKKPDLIFLLLDIGVKPEEKSNFIEHILRAAPEASVLQLVDKALAMGIKPTFSALDYLALGGNKIIDASLTLASLLKKIEYSQKLLDPKPANADAQVHLQKHFRILLCASLNQANSSLAKILIECLPVKTDTNKKLYNSLFNKPFKFDEGITSHYPQNAQNDNIDKLRSLGSQTHPFTPLHLACLNYNNSNSAIIGALLDRGAQVKQKPITIHTDAHPNIQKSRETVTPLYFLIQHLNNKRAKKTHIINTASQTQFTPLPNDLIIAITLILNADWPNFKPTTFEQQFINDSLTKLITDETSKLTTLLAAALGDKSGYQELLRKCFTNSVLTNSQALLHGLQPVNSQEAESETTKTCRALVENINKLNFIKASYAEKCAPEQQRKLSILAKK